MPSSSVFRCPSPGCANVGGNVVSPSSILSSSPPLPCSWLPFCQMFCLSVIHSSCYMPCPSPFCRLYFSKMSLTLVLLLITEFLTLSCSVISNIFSFHGILCSHYFLFQKFCNIPCFTEHCSQCRSL